MDESKQISDQQQLLVPPPSSPSSSSSSQSTFGDVNGGDVVVNTPTDGGAFSTTTTTTTITTTTIPSDCSPSTGDAAISTTQQEKETPDAIAPCSSSSTTAEEKKSLLPDPPCGRLLSEQELLPCSSLSSQATLGDVNGGDVVVNTPTDGGATTTTISSDGSPTDFSSNTNPIEHPEWSCLSVSTTGTPAVVGSPRGTLSKMSFPNELCKYKTVIRHSFITQGVPENTELLVNGYGTLVSSSALLPNWKNNKFMLNQFSVGLLLEIPKQQNPGQNSENSTINTIKFNK